MTLNPKIIARRNKEKQDLKKKIFNFSYQVVKNSGADALTIRGIAEKIEYSLPVIYNLYKNKDAILLKIAVKSYEKLHTEVFRNQNKMNDNLKNNFISWSLINENLFSLINNEKYAKAYKETLFIFKNAKYTQRIDLLFVD
jgi:AcrR family transcriptional regulator